MKTFQYGCFLATPGLAGSEANNTLKMYTYSAGSGRCLLDQKKYAQEPNFFALRRKLLPKDRILSWLGFNDLVPFRNTYSKMLFKGHFNGILGHGSWLGHFYGGFKFFCHYIIKVPMNSN